MRRAILACAWLSVGATGVGFFLPWARIDLREHAIAKELQWAAPAVAANDEVKKALGWDRVTVQIRRGTETITGDLPRLSDIPKQVSGVQIPQMANQERTEVAIALVELLTQTRLHFGVKSYMVYLVPGIALLCGVLLILLSGRLVVTAGVAGCCAMIASLGFLKLLTTNTQSLFVAITIGEGLWLSLWGYVGLVIAATGFSLRHGRRA